MPTSDLPGATTSMSFSTIVRLYCVEQLPQERTSLPKSSTRKPLTVSVPAPLNCSTLSSAFLAPPPITLYWADEDFPLKLAASSPTSSHHTFCSVQLPLQCTPSAAGVPMITFFSVAPSASSKTGSWPSSWLSPPRAPVP